MMEQTVSDGVVGGRKGTHKGVGAHPPRDATGSLLLSPGPPSPRWSHLPLVPPSPPSFHSLPWFSLVPLIPLVSLVPPSPF